MKTLFTILYILLILSVSEVERRSFGPWVYARSPVILQPAM